MYLIYAKNINLIFLQEIILFMGLFKYRKEKKLKYKHFKGGIYKYICDATLEWCPDDEKSNVVVYESVETGKRWVRPRGDFHGMVERDGKQFKRFTQI